MKRRTIDNDDLPIGSVTDDAKRPGPGSGGQSGDLEGISDVEGASSESVAELLEEGQAFEAGIVSGIENAPDADQGPVRTHEVLEDDVPREYDDVDPSDQR
jgi:hypothetical protein